MALANPIQARSGETFKGASPSFTPIGARRRSGSGNAITELGHHRACQGQASSPQNSTRALSLDSPITCRQPNCTLHADANMGHRFAILMAHVGALRPVGLRRR